MKKYNIYISLVVILIITLACVIRYDNTTENIEKNYLTNVNATKLTSNIISYEIDDSLISYLDIDEEVEEEYEYVDTPTICQFIDEIAPTIKYKKTLSTTVGKKINLLKKVKATDNIDEKVEVSVEGDYDFNKVGTYKLKYVAVDSSNNRTEKDFTLKVKEVVIQPVIQIPSEPIEVVETPPVAASSGNIRSDMVNIAKSQIGVYNGNPYWTWYGFKHRVEWCAVFVSWVAGQAGALNSYIPKFAGVRSGVNYFVSQGRWQGKSYTPNPGDIIFFDYYGRGRAGHVGIVEKVVNGRVYTIEGNTKHNNVGNTSYPLNGSMIYGYGIPAY